MPKKPPTRETNDAHLINVSLLLDERDAINTAKGRVRRFVAVASKLVEERDAAFEFDEEDLAAIADVLDIIREDINAIDAVFAHADERQRKARRGTGAELLLNNAGGAR